MALANTSKYALQGLLWLAMDDITAIAEAFTAHWRLFGLYPGAELTEEDGVLWYRSPIRHLPYNGVVRTRIEGAPEPVIQRICDRFRRERLPFMWAVLPGDHPLGYELLLAKAGLDRVEEPTGMSIDLENWESMGSQSPATIVPGEIEPALSDYEHLIRTYWKVPESDRAMIPVLNRHWTGARNPGRRLVAYLDGKPVGKLFLNLSGLPETAAVYGVVVVPEARGRGIAQAMMERAMSGAKELGARRMVLHSSSMGLHLYEKLGFAARCTIPVYATAPIFGTHHH
jgi:GNAT superfamily N-acetyltransferase